MIKKVKSNNEDSQSGTQPKIVRTVSAGVFYGQITRRDGKEVEMVNVRRIWYWAGAASLSQLAQMGTNKPRECKFTMAVDRTVLTEAIEILDVTVQAQKSIDGVVPWVV
jgi:hypothetical protein